MNAQEALQQATLYTDDVEYLMIHLPPRGVTAAAGILAEIGEPFGAVIADKDEVTLVMPADLLEEFQRRLVDVKISNPLRLITFDLELDPDLTGFMALVGRLLADAGVPIIPLGAYARDHILVYAEDFETAWKTLQHDD